MSAPDQAVGTLLTLPSATLIGVGRALARGTLRHGFSRQSLQPFVGNEAERVDMAFRDLVAGSALSIPMLGLLCESIGRALAERDAVGREIQLVLSGPEVAGTPVVDTRSTVMSLFEEAEEEVIVSSYVFYEAAEFFHRLAEKHDANPAFRVIFLVDLSHRIAQDRPLPVALVAQAFSEEFRKKHWPGKRLPEIWHDPRKFDSATTAHGLLHAKTVVVDHKVAFVTSANFTGAAQTKNIEAGVLIRTPRIVVQLHAYFAGLISTGLLLRL